MMIDDINNVIPVSHAFIPTQLNPMGHFCDPDVIWNLVKSNYFKGQNVSAIIGDVVLWFGDSIKPDVSAMPHSIRFASNKDNLNGFFQ